MLACLTGAVCVLPVIVPLTVLLLGLPGDAALSLYLIGMAGGLILNTIIGMTVSALLWQWMAWAHRPTLGAGA